MRKIVATYWFRSSNGKTLYETLQYNDGASSCNCPGWCRRTQPDGSRSCKHTRILLQPDLAANLAERFSIVEQTIVVTATKTVTVSEGRAFNFED